MHLPSFKIVLVITNYAVLIFLLLIMIDHYKSYNNLYSWSSSFHLLCLLWLSIRGPFWLGTVIAMKPWGTFAFYFLYWLPNPIQFGSFMLLPLFFTQVLYPDLWKRYWNSVRPLYYFLIVSMVAFQLLWALLAAIEEDNLSNCVENNINASPEAYEQCFHTEYSSNVFRGVAAFCFTFLAFCHAAYAVKISNLEKSYYQRYFVLSPKMMVHKHTL